MFSRHRNTDRRIYMCPYCGSSFDTQRGVKAHISSTAACRDADFKENALAAQNRSPSPDLREMGSRSRKTAPSDPAQVPDSEGFSPDVDDRFSPEPSCKRPRYQTTIEDEDESEEDTSTKQPSGYKVEEYPQRVASIRGKGSLPFPAYREVQSKAGHKPWFPFDNREEWELAEWFTTSGVSQTDIDRYLKMKITRERTVPSFKNNYAFQNMLDKLPAGPKFKCKAFTVVGDLMDEDDQPLTEELELWWRDPLEVIKEMLSNVMLANEMHYKPVRVSDASGSERFYDEMWTATWWWDIQDKLEEGATIVPIILSSDKTKLSVFSGDKVAWPVYLTIRNVPKGIRRRPSMHATILLGYIPTSKLECFSAKRRAEEGYKLFHWCMNHILAPLKEAGQHGVEMVCTDGNIRLVHPILAAYVADYPEQCLIACCKENRCVRCRVPPDKRGELLESPPREPITTLTLIDDRFDPGRKSKSASRFEEDGVRAIHKPFWEGLPHTNIFSCFTPDLLHQLHKGVFKTHLVSWCSRLMSEEEMDKRFMTMTRHPTLRHFKKGISTISQWTGNEYKQMEKVFLGVVAGALGDSAMKATRSILDFIMLAQYTTHSTTSLHQMKTALEDFHRYKNAFLDPVHRPHFNIPKIHAISHYIESIVSHGTTDGFNTESPERLHIDFAKKAYRASNKRDYLSQMTKWLSTQEAIQKQKVYLVWIGALEAQAVDGQGNKAKDTDGDCDDDEDKVTAVGSDDTSSESDLEPDEPSSVKLRGSKVILPMRPSNPLTPLTDLTSKYGAVDFLPRLTEFLKANLSSNQFRQPMPHDRFDVYKIIRFSIPFHSDSSDTLIDRVRASPAIPERRTAKARKKAKPAHFDTVLIKTGYKGLGNIECGKGYRVVQVRAMFTVPKHIANYPHPLAYVEYFTNFTRMPNPRTKLLEVSRVVSGINNKRQSAVICLDSIYRSCHLIPKFGKKVDARWKAETVLEQCNHFYVNDSLDLHSYHIL
ncbi:hypothetical protein FRC03_000539 [Tulasnella sp. 419]|nr:hypothetical protein FRC03_000539 [Tulasnella sp. 419]